MAGALSRIILRYGIGALAGWGIGEKIAADPDVQMALTVGLTMASGALVEGWYYLAKKYGWIT